jgi:hypothetical protein
MTRRQDAFISIRTNFMFPKGVNLGGYKVGVAAQLYLQFDNYLDHAMTK